MKNRIARDLGLSADAKHPRGVNEIMSTPATMLTKGTQVEIRIVEPSYRRLFTP
jgi:hypothetical protein